MPVSDDHIFDPTHALHHLINVVFFAVLLCSSELSIGLEIQQLKITESSLNRHIQQPTITAILKDKTGILWVGTQQGLYRFNGSGFILYTSSNTDRFNISASDIRGIDQDLEGNIYVATYGAGLLYRDRSSKIDFPFFQEAKDSPKFITHMTSSNNGLIWVGNDDGLSVFYHNSIGLVRSDVIGDDHAHNLHPTAMKSDSAGNVLIATHEGLFGYFSKFRIFKKVELFKQLDIKSRRVISIEATEENHFICGTESGEIFVLESLDNPTVISNTKLGDGSLSITKIFYHEDILWIGTNQGLYISDIELTISDTLHTENSSLSNNHITSIAASGHLVLVGTYQGLNNLVLTPFELFNKKNSSVNNDVLAFDQDSDGNLWVGTFDGIYIYDKANNDHKPAEAYFADQKLADQRATSILFNGDDLWLGFRRSGIQILNKTSKTADGVSSMLPGNLEVTKILRSKNGDVWIATYNAGLIRVSGSSIAYFFNNNGISSFPITALFESSQGELFVGTYNGIYIFDRKSSSFEKIAFIYNGKDNAPFTLTIAQNSNSDIWIGTKDYGVFIWPKSQQEIGSFNLAQVTDLEVSRGSTVYGILFDQDGFAWCSTQNGILKIDKAGRVIKIFTVADGLQGQDFNFGAAFSDSDGNLYFGGINGYNKIDPTRHIPESNTPNIALNSIQFSQSTTQNFPDISNTPRLVLSHSDYFVTFSFSVLDFLDPENNRYKYKLENFDPDWIDNETRSTATYTNLPPGKYVFRVKGANSAGVWNEEGISLPVTVLPPWWLTWWAKSLYSMLLAFGIWAFVRVYLSYAIQQRANILAIEKQEAYEKADDDMQEQLESQDALIRSMYQHNTDTLELISQFLSIQREHETQVFRDCGDSIQVTRVHALAILEQCLTFEDDELLANLHRYTDVLISRLLPAASVAPERIITINEVTSRPIPMALASQVAVILYELLRNCLEHAFGDDTPACYIQVSFEKVEDGEGSPSHYHLRVRDSGIGIPEFIDIDHSESTGLSIVKFIADRLSATVEVTADTGSTTDIIIPV